MVDETDPTPPETEPLVNPADAQSAEDVAEAIGGITENFVKATEGAKQFHNRMVGIGASSRDVDQLTKSMKGIESVTQASTSTLANLKKVFDSIDARGATASIGDSLGGLKQRGAEMASSLLGDIDAFVKEANKNVTGLGDIANSTLIAMAAGGKKAFADLISGADFIPGLPAFGEMERRIQQIDKLAKQTGISFHGSFEMGADATQPINDALVNVQANLLGTREQALEIATTLSQGMGAGAASAAVYDLVDANGALAESLTNTEVAAAVANATGLRHGEVAQAMVIAQQELGATMENSVKIFGTIQNAAKDSGLGFAKTKTEIMAAAQSMKMWGGTVESVTPIYNAFAKSLGEGRKGLTPELFQGMIQGIKNMGFETKALLGLQAGGGRVGALQAGFEMEAALEQGPEGMQKVMDNVMATLKQFGGGRITTLQEAAKDPEAARNFAMQRQLMEKLLGITGANANRTLEMLSGIQDSGMQLTDNMSKDLHQLISGGKQVAEQTTGTAEAAAMEQSAATDKASEVIVGELKNLLTGTDFNKGIMSLSKALTDSIKSGKVDLTAMRTAATDIARGGRRETRRETVQQERRGRAAAERLETRQRPTTTEAAEQVVRGRAPQMPPRADVANANLDPLTRHIERIANEMPAAQEPGIPALPPVPAATPVAPEIPQAQQALPPARPTTEQIIPPPPPEPPPLLPGGPGTRVEPPAEPQAEEDRFGFSINRAMEQYRKMRDADRQPAPETQRGRAEEAINRAQEVAPTPTRVARQDIATTATVREQQRVQQVTTPVAAAAEPAPTTRAQPEELEVKIKVTLDNGTLNLTPMMEEQILTIIKGKIA